jgi:CRAL/TRIO domain
MKPVMAHVSKIFKERIFRNYIMNAPMLFSGVFAVIKMVIDKKTQKKILISSKGESPVMAEHINPF